MLLLGGSNALATGPEVIPRVLKVDLATGTCTPQPPLLWHRERFVAARLPDRRVVCAGGGHLDVRDGQPAIITAEVFGPADTDSPGGPWRWRALPHMSVGRSDAIGCVLSDGRFAIFGGTDANGHRLSSCEVLTLDGGARWDPLPPMLDAWEGCTCEAVGGCVVVVIGGENTGTVEVYEEAQQRWRRLPCTHLPGVVLASLYAGSALI